MVILETLLKYYPLSSNSLLFSDETPKKLFDKVEFDEDDDDDNKQDQEDIVLEDLDEEENK